VHKNQEIITWSKQVGYKFLCTMYVYSFHSKKSVVLEFQTSYLIIRLIQKFYINIIYFVKTYFIIRDTLLMIYLFYNLYKIFE